MTQDSKTSLSYKDSGVDIDAGNQLVNHIKSIAKSTSRPGVMGGLGGFGALFELPTGYKEPVLVSGTDGVGTKLKLALELGIHDTIGIDLVAMCVNDLIVGGAEPLFFLDYYATGKLNVDIATQVVKGIGYGCQLSGCALTGGETAEMPGMYDGEDYDLAGFCVGIVEKSKIIDGSKVQAGDSIIGLGSSGPHSNGYSLIRKVLEHCQADLQADLNGQTLASALMAPTRIYVKPLLNLLTQHTVHAMAHITGGGFQENIPRVLPEHCKAIVNLASWKRPAVFDWLQQQGNIADLEMLRTFNCGIGMILVIPASQKKACMTALSDAGEAVFELGVVAERQDGQESVEFTQ